MHVALHGELGDAQLPGYLAVRLALADEAQNLALAEREAGQLELRTAAPFCTLELVDHVLDEVPGQRCLAARYLRDAN